MFEERVGPFQRNPALETLLSQIGDDLEPTESHLLAAYRSEEMVYPLILVMGPLRSGTTLFMQWLANLGIAAYPSNLLSRFYRTPIVGAKIQLLLTDPRYNFRNELWEFSSPVDFVSENGKTRGVLAPNEFWYFWRRFLPAPDQDIWSDDELRQCMDVETMRAELVGMMDVFGKPFAAKGMLFNYNIPFFNAVFEKALFIQIKRDLADNVASVLGARKRQLGTENSWYSFKIPEYAELAGLDPIKQVVGQVCAINRAVTTGIELIPESRKLSIEYEDFCRDPTRVLREICDRIGLPSRMRNYTGPSLFQASRAEEDERAPEIRRAIAEISPRYAYG